VLPFVVTPASSADSSGVRHGLALAPTTWGTGARLARTAVPPGRRSAIGQPVTRTSTIWSSNWRSHGHPWRDMVASTNASGAHVSLVLREVTQTSYTTGLTSDGVYLIEKRPVVGASQTNSDSTRGKVDLWAGERGRESTVRALRARNGEWANRTAMPPLRVPDFNMS